MPVFGLSSTMRLLKQATCLPATLHLDSWFPPVHLRNQQNLRKKKNSTGYMSFLWVPLLNVLGFLKPWLPWYSWISTLCFPNLVRLMRDFTSHLGLTSQPFFLCYLQIKNCLNVERSRQCQVNLNAFLVLSATLFSKSPFLWLFSVAFSHLEIP